MIVHRLTFNLYSDIRTLNFTHRINVRRTFCLIENKLRHKFFSIQWFYSVFHSLSIPPAASRLTVDGNLLFAGLVVYSCLYLDEHLISIKFF